MTEGTKTLRRAALAYVACVAFPILCLLSLAVGCSWRTATVRGAVASVAGLIVGRYLFYPLVDALMAALAEAERKRREAEE